MRPDRGAGRIDRFLPPLPENSPHWVVVTGFDERYVRVNDPHVARDAGRAITDAVNVPILREDFDRMARYNKSGQEAVIVLYGR